MATFVSNIVPPGGLEKHGVLTLCMRIVTVPLLNALPSACVKMIMTSTSFDASAVVAKGGSTHALEAMYTRYQRRLFSRGLLQGLADSFWHHVVSQPKALRNRLRIVRQLVKAETTALIQTRQEQRNSEPVRVLSIAGGSSRSIIQTIVDLKAAAWEPAIEVVTIDKDQSALDVGARVAHEAGVSGHFHWLCGAARDMVTLLPDARFDIIEIVGLVDYLSDPRAIRLFSAARHMLRNEGVLVAANVIPNPEIPFVHKAGWPRMVYRTPEAFHALFKRCGFAKTDVTVEPLRIHCIAVARR